MLAGSALPRRGVALLGAGSVSLAAVVTFVLAVRFWSQPPAGDAFRQVLWTWMSAGGFSAHIALYLDPLSLIMTLVVTGVGALIHLYSTGYMADDASYARFFAYMNLFVAAMLLLVLGDNLLLLYLGWEGVGLCSYLLIGFWYSDAANSRAANKAFITTRVGDTAMAIGLFLLFTHLGTLDIQELMTRAQAQWAPGSTIAILAAALLLGGALGKSGQLPLQTWLPDAMAGPTPVSALIHAATMVTAGVYLVARTHVLFELAPPVQFAVAVIGAATLLIAGFSACAQRDIKRVLAYSTISQIGYMFLALGVGAWSAAIFHLVTHAFFKALLFMAAGMIIVALHHEQDLLKMGGLRKKLPLVYAVFLVGAMSLAAVPFITSGFYSKDLILWDVWNAPHGGMALWAAGVIGAGLTGFYTFRMVFLAFFGEAKTQPHGHLGMNMVIPVVILAVLATIGGFMDIPRTLGGFHLFTEFASRALPAAHGEEASIGMEAVVQVITAAIALLGIFFAYLYFLQSPQRAASFVKGGLGSLLQRFSASGCGFDAVYDRVLIRPFIAAARIGRNDFIDWLYRGIAGVCQIAHDFLHVTQTGAMRLYLMGMALGAAVIAAILVFT